MTRWMLDHYFDLRVKRSRMAGIMARYRVADWWIA